MRRVARALGRALAVAFALAVASAAAAGNAEIPERKRALILELVRLAGSEQSGEQLAEAFLAQIRAVYPTLVEQVMEEEQELDEADRARLAERLSDFERFATAFSARFPERIDVAALLESVYLPLYDARFSEQELQQIVDFYHTQAGRKTLAVMPGLVQQGREATLMLLQPRVLELVGEILAEERSQVLAPAGGGAR